MKLSDSLLLMPPKSTKAALVSFRCDLVADVMLSADFSRSSSVTPISFNSSLAAALSLQLSSRLVGFPQLFSLLMNWSFTFWGSL